MSTRTTELKRTIEDYTTRAVIVGLEPKVTLPAITIALKRWSDLVAIDEASPSQIDGFGNRTTGAREADAVGVRFDREGQVIEARAEDIGPDSIVERAALMLLERGDPADTVHIARCDADAAAQRAADALESLVRALDRADKARATAPLNTLYCWVARLRGLPFDEVWKIHTRTTFKDYLTPAWPEKRPVSHWVYRFVRDNRRLPTDDEMRQRLQRETVLIHSGAS